MNELKVIENELVPVYETSTGEKVVYGTELYETLGVKSRFNDWVRNRLEDCEAIENEDFDSFTKILVKSGRPQMDYIIKLDIAKEMAMLERNEKGRQVRRYFINIEKKYKDKVDTENKTLIGLQCVKFIADDLRVAESSRLYMYENYCKDVGIPTGFLPKYEDNGNRGRKTATELLKENGCDLSVVKFNKLLLENGYLEEKQRKSLTKGTKKYKTLTDKGLKYGVNLICDKNQKETQPYYYEDTFMELYRLIA